MNEEINNVVPNSYEPQRNNNGVKVLLIVLLILAIVVIGLLSYKIFVIDKKNNSNEVTTNTGEKYSKINYEIKKEKVDDIETNVLYVEGEKVKESINVAGLVSFKEFKDLIIVESKGPGMSSDIFAVDKDRNIIGFVDSNKNSPKYVELPNSLDDGMWSNFSLNSVDDNKLVINVNRQSGNAYVDWYCYLDDKNIISSYKVEYEYLGNGKFEGKFIDSKTVVEEYKEELKSCNVETSDKINYEIKEEKDGEMTWKYLYVNGKKIKDTRAEELKIEQYKDVLIVELSNPGPSILTVIVDKNGKVTNLDYELKVEKGWVPKLSSYRIEGNSIYVSWPIQYSQGHFDAECRIEDTSLLSSYEVKYEYMGNGKISDGEVVNKKTISDLYKNKCDKFIVFSDILTGKLCTRSNDKIKCYSDTQYNNLKDRLNEIFTEANCKNEDDAYYCELNDNYCRLNNDGVYCYTNYD